METFLNAVKCCSQFKFDNEFVNESKSDFLGISKGNPINSSAGFTGIIFSPVGSLKTLPSPVKKKNPMKIFDFHCNNLYVRLSKEINWFFPLGVKDQESNLKKSTRIV